MQPLAGFSSCKHVGGGGRGRGMVGHVGRYFRILFVDNRFLGEVFKSNFFLGMKMASKKWAGLDSFPINQLTSFKCSQAVLGSMHRFAHFFS